MSGCVLVIILQDALYPTFMASANFHGVIILPSFRLRNTVPLNEELERYVHIKAGSITLFVCHKIQEPGSTKAGLTRTENMN